MIARMGRWAIALLPLACLAVLHFPEAKPSVWSNREFFNELRDLDQYINKREGSAQPGSGGQQPSSGSGSQHGVGAVHIRAAVTRLDQGALAVHKRAAVAVHKRAAVAVHKRAAVAVHKRAAVARLDQGAAAVHKRAAVAVHKRAAVARLDQGAR